MNLTKKRIFSVITLFFVLLIIELTAYISSFYFVKKGALYSTPKVLSEEYQRYLSLRDETLGWPPRFEFDTSHKSVYDKSGSRFIPAFPDPDKYPSTISIYGDSYVYGVGVSNEDAFTNVLSKLLNCRVANYGVPGYGTDQAYLRFQKNINDKASVVILGYLTENILRNVNQYRLLLYHGDGNFTLKPAFIIDASGQLKLIPLAKLKYEEFLQLANFPERHLKYDYFVPGGNSGILKQKFPYTLTLLKMMIKNFHIKAKLKGIPWYKEFYERGHSSNALLITFAIMNEFCLKARSLHKKPIVLFIPTALDLEYYKKNKSWPYENLTNFLEKKKVEFIDAGPRMIGYLQKRNPSELFGNSRVHLSVEGNRVLAEIVHTYLKKNGFFM